MNPNWKIAIRYCVYGIVIGGILSMMALIVAVSQSGFGKPSPFAVILVSTAYWPMLITGWSTHNLFVSFWVLPANLFGWALIGLLYGLILIRSTK